MDNVQMFDLSQDALSYIVSIGAPFVAGLLMLALFAFAGKITAKQVKSAWKTVRKPLVEAVDEPTDPIIRAMASLFDRNPQELVGISAPLMRAVRDTIDKALTIIPD